ncbi:MAG: mannose-1-phosphate guanylyltransferase [Spirochaetaceae bacterium]|nr:MAG: mannose-1-phosphate guanylyltransferase [Spirochaetaceae bacterium]
MVDSVMILAGGSGSRLWPASTAARPKQFLDPGTGRSLLQMTLERAAAVAPSGPILIVTHHSQAAEVSRQCRDLEHVRDRVEIAAEPEMRNTGPAVALGLFRLSRMENAHPRATTLVLASDHLISPVEAFAEDVEKADLLAREGFLVVFGVPPTRPETGYGYIEAGERHGPGRMVASFREKPDAETAEEFLRRGSFSWNSGMFVFRRDVMLEELDRFEPDITAPFRTAHGSDRDETPSFYGSLPAQSLDRAVMERSTRVAMVETTFRWNDVGSWDEMAALAEEGAFGAGPAGEASLVTVESKNNYVYADQPVALCGVDDLVVVVRNGRVLVARRGKGQLVKEVVDILRARGRDEEL